MQRITLSDKGMFLLRGRLLVAEDRFRSPGEIERRIAEAGFAPGEAPIPDPDKARDATMAGKILTAHDRSVDRRNLKIRFDALASHDITYVGIIQTARAAGLKAFPVPYVLTNCHNSLCAVGGTINEDDHLFGLSAARKYGGIFVPAHLAVIHQYVRERMVACGAMILGSDSHTRYGALGTLGIGEGGPEIVKQVLGRTYDLSRPKVVAVYLEGSPAPGVGPQDVALFLIRSVFADGFVKNAILEFVGPGIAGLPVDFRNGIDVMTTETACLSSIWQTDDRVKDWYAVHGRPEAYRFLAPGDICYYDGVIGMDLGRVEPMIALPFHPSLAWPIAELNRNAGDILREVEILGNRQLEHPDMALKLTGKALGGRLRVDQGVVVGCAGGTFDNIRAVAEILDGRTIGAGAFSLSVYPASQPILLELIRNRSVEKLLQAGATVRTAFCGPCFGAGETPAHQTLSARHATRNFPNREGSKPAQGQLAAVALMDARSIAATAINGGVLTAATDIASVEPSSPYRFDPRVYDHRVYRGFGAARFDEALRFGPNIADWPEMHPLPEDLLLRVASVIHDAVTTTDELIPSGDTASYRSNPIKLAEYTLSRKDPGYVARAKAFGELETLRRKAAAAGGATADLRRALTAIWPEGESDRFGEDIAEAGFGTVIFAVKPGDGSAREQAASCQRVLGGWANIAVEYATKRYRSNLINWGMLPFTVPRPDGMDLRVDDLLHVRGIRRAVQTGRETVSSVLIRAGERRSLELMLGDLSPEEREIILAGCLINVYARKPEPPEE